jgi:hypothetical protein
MKARKLNKRTNCDNILYTDRQKDISNSYYIYWKVGNKVFFKNKNNNSRTLLSAYSVKAFHEDIKRGYFIRIK